MSFLVYALFFALAVLGLYVALLQHRYFRGGDIYAAQEHRAATIGDPFIMPYVMAVASCYRDRWETWEITLSLTAGLIISLVYHYTKPKRVERRGHLYEPPSKKHPRGWLGWSAYVHIPYFALAVAGLILFYLFSGPLDRYVGWTTLTIPAMAVFLILSTWVSDAGHYRDRQTRRPAKLGTVAGIGAVIAVTLFRMYQ